ncbi:serine hydrolase domain-containing protein [Microbacterium thalassium]|uniref:CubicO group peptidase (Beta-lactamase class C family) n=1 Tax=Microbacterium thalassium TaxID=362649 RepID=A0A7X0FMC2_9MICO|nr:serine hydrolase [Microbacterium thalassium]MBB6390170.1 CubicO group peptidase (beta-lactamase class C family) [Microbacterium thalassium]
MRTQSRGVGRAVGALAVVATTLALGAGCSGGPSPEELATVDYAPVADGDWQVSTPSDAGLDPAAVAELYYDAGELETIYSLLVVKDGSLIAEDYFHIGSIEQKALVQSVAKSFTSALVGIAIEQGCLAGVDERMVDFFPEYADRMGDLRKNEITVEEMLQLRAGYPPEESDEALWEAVWSGDYAHLVADVPLNADPGTEFQYSNLTAHWLGIIVARACDTDLETLAREQLLGPMGGEVGPWRKDVDGYNWAAGELHVTARDAAKFGMLYLDEGEYDGTRVISADWVRDSLQTYSEGAYGNIGDFRDVGYGYLWWSARIGDHDVNFAWGHGGQLIVLVHDLDMVVVVTADPFYETFGSESWKHEKANFELVGEFIAGLS